MSTLVTRRRFVQSMSLASVGYWATGEIAPAASKSANEKINMAIVGAGGQGSANTGGVSHERIVALCDVDERRAGGAFRRYPDAARYKDFRTKVPDERRGHRQGGPLRAAARRPPISPFSGAHWARRLG